MPLRYKASCAFRIARDGKGRSGTARSSPGNRIARGRIARLAAAAVFLAGFFGCGRSATEKSDAELALNAQQAAGRAIYGQYCAACHPAYSSSGDKGPGLKGLFKKQFLPSGLPANDRFVGQTIRMGRGMMPPMGDALSQAQLADLLAYLHTL